MAETYIDHYGREETITVFSSDHNGIKRLRKMVEQYPDEVKVKFDEGDLQDGGVCVSMPRKWFRWPKPPTKRAPLSEERRAECAARLAEARKAQSTT